MQPETCRMFSSLRMNDSCLKYGKCNFMNDCIFPIFPFFPPSRILLLHCPYSTALPIIINCTCHIKLSQERLVILICQLSSRNLACSTSQMLEVSFNMTDLPGILFTPGKPGTFYQIFYYFTNFSFNEANKQKHNDDLQASFLSTQTHSLGFLV